MNDNVSIIVPVYNAEKTINKCMDSIINQTYKNIEIICIDDGSTDNSLKICDAYARKDNRIIVKHIQNSGVSNARNIAIKISSGKYIGFVDSDDYIDNNMVEILLKEMKRNNVEIGVCNIVKEDDDKNIIEINNIDNLLLSREEFFDSLFLNKNILGYSCNKLYYKDIINNIRFNKNYKMTEDSLFNSQIVDMNTHLRCVYVDDVYYHYIQKNNKKTVDLNNIKQCYSYFKVKEEQIKIAEKNKFNIDQIKAIYCINYIKCSSFLLIKKIIPNKIFEEIKNNYKLYKNEIKLSNISKNLKKQFLIAKYVPFIFRLNILIKNKNYVDLIK